MKAKPDFYFTSILLAASLWGTAGIFVRTASQSLSKMDLVLGRAFFTSLVIGIIILLKDKKLFKIKPVDIWIFASAGLFSIVLFNYSYYRTMALTSLSAAAVLLYTAPFFVVIISAFLFKEKIGVAKICALIIAFLGCCMVTGLFDSAVSIGKNAVFFGLLTGFGYALYTVFGRILLERGYNTLTITLYVFLFAFVFSLFFVNPKTAINHMTANPKALITVILMAVFNTVVPYLLYTVGLKEVSPSAAPIIATVEPVVATLVGCFIFKEEITALGILGILAVIVSVAILNIKPFRIKAYAKINLALNVVGKREDGYHILDMIMQTVSLHDTVYVIKSRKLSLSCSDSELSGEENLAYKAAKAFFDYTKIIGGARIYIKKRIPKAAGLGGGSSDAAAVLLMLNDIYKAGLSREELEKISLYLGADVPFFIEGGTKRAQGIGEILTRLKPLKMGYFVIVKNCEKPSTGKMYSEIDGKETKINNISPIISAIENGDLELLSQSLYNSFDEVWPDKTIKNELLNMGAIGVGLSGSGPSYFGIFKTGSRAKKAYSSLKKRYGEGYLCRPI